MPGSCFFRKKETILDDDPGGVFVSLKQKDKKGTSFERTIICYCFQKNLSNQGLFGKNQRLKTGNLIEFDFLVILWSLCSWFGVRFLMLFQ